MPSPQAFNLSQDTRQRRILFRSWHRGMREMDLVLGRFATAEIARLSSELDDYERLLEAQDATYSAGLPLKRKYRAYTILRFYGKSVPSIAMPVNPSITRLRSGCWPGAPKTFN